MTTQDASQADSPVVQIDIVSDVMCPWCIVGYRQLEQALGATGTGAYVRWHPFELNPQMGPEGENLRDHLMRKYGSSAEQSDAARAHLTQLGDGLGIDFQFRDETRIVNTFLAHQLLDWAQQQGLQHPLKLALFEAYFTAGKDVSDVDVLLDVAAGVGLDRDVAAELLQSGRRAEETRARQQFWTSRGISGVPTMVFDGKYLLTGAQGAQNYAEMLKKVVSEKEAA